METSCESMSINKKHISSRKTLIFSENNNLMEMNKQKPPKHDQNLIFSDIDDPIVPKLFTVACTIYKVHGS